jgi:hypothetical protein
MQDQLKPIETASQISDDHATIALSGNNKDCEHNIKFVFFWGFTSYRDYQIKFLKTRYPVPTPYPHLLVHGITTHKIISILPQTLEEIYHLSLLIMPRTKKFMKRERKHVAQVGKASKHMPGC